MIECVGPIVGSKFFEVAVIVSAACPCFPPVAGNASRDPNCILRNLIYVATVAGFVPLECHNLTIRYRHSLSKTLPAEIIKHTNIISTASVLLKSLICWPPPWSLGITLGPSRQRGARVTDPWSKS